MIGTDAQDGREGDGMLGRWLLARTSVVERLRHPLDWQVWAAVVEQEHLRRLPWAG